MPAIQTSRRSLPITDADGHHPLYFKNANVDKDKVCGAGFDLSGPTAQAIKAGYVRAVLDQQPFLQGYLPIMQMYLTSKFGFAGFDVDTGAAIISKANIDAVAPLAAAGIRYSWNRRALPPPRPGRRQSLLFLPGKGE